MTEGQFTTVSKDDAATRSEERFEKCCNSLRGAINRRIDYLYTDGEEIVVENVYLCFYYGFGGLMGTLDEMDRAIEYVRKEYEEVGWSTRVETPLTWFLRRPARHKRRLVLS